MSGTLSLAVMLALASSCVVHEAPPYEGSVVFDWSVGGTTDPSACHLAGASAFSVTIFDSRDRAVGTFDAPCTWFATSIALGEGRYSADAFLIDDAGRARTTTIRVFPFQVIGGTSLDIPVDFPTQSFY